MEVLQSIVAILSLMYLHFGATFRRIGTPLTQGEFPYLVYLQHTERNDHPYCLATIIASDLLLTVATCFERDPAIQDISGYIRKPLDPYRHRQFFAISGELEFIVNFPGTFRDFPWYLQSIHPSQLYSFATGYGDFAYVKLDYPYGQMNNIPYPTLPACGYDPQIGLHCTVLGWIAQPNGVIAMAKTSMKIEDRTKCRLMGRPIRDKSLICASFVNQDGDFTRLDTGGPLLCPRDRRGNVVQAGVNSYFGLTYAPDLAKKVYGFSSVGFYLEHDGQCDIPDYIPPEGDFSGDEWNQFIIPDPDNITLWQE